VFYQLPEAEIRKRIESRRVKIAVIGLGRVGLPLASTLADAGFEVIGIDINEKVAALTNDGISYFKDEIGLQDLVEKNVKNGKLRATLEVGSAEKCDLVIITVPTLITEENEPDIEAVKAAARAIAKFSKGKVIVLESTVPPFTTQNLGKIIQERSGLKVGEDFGLVYSPERVRAPQVLKDLRTYPKIVGGINERSTFIVSEVYSAFAPSIIKMSSPEAAEIEKVVENTQRDVNIAFANELAKICEVYGADVFEVTKAANSQPFCKILSPGCGVGGHCIPIDPYYLIKDVERRGTSRRC
jgi:nucleotide sugar dehydrogenase